MKPIKVKFTRWHQGMKHFATGSYGFAAPFKDEERPEDVTEIFVHGSAMGCGCLWGEDSMTVPRGTVAYVMSLEKTERGYRTDQVLCEKCKLWVEEQNARAAAERRVDALFARGHKFDVSERFPFFYKPSLSGGSLDVVLREFRRAAVGAALAGMSDAEVTQAAEEAARVSASILRECSH
jgi:hypothetical protein